MVSLKVTPGYIVNSVTCDYVIIYQGGICQGNTGNNMLRIFGRDKINVKITR